MTIIIAGVILLVVGFLVGLPLLFWVGLIVTIVGLGLLLASSTS